MKEKGGGDNNFGQVFSDLDTDRQKEVLKTAKTLLKVQRTSHVLIDIEGVSLSPVEEKKEGRGLFTLKELNNQ